MADEEFKIEFVNPVNDVGRGTFHNIEIAHHRAENAALRAQGSALEHDLDRARGHAQEYLNELEPLRSRVKELEGERDAYRARKDAAYEERNNVVACLARLFPSGIARTNIPGWSEDWHGCVYINLPSGQISYHYHDSQAYLFEGLPPYNGAWDGHDKDAVHARLQSTGAAAEEKIHELIAERTALRHDLDKSRGHAQEYLQENQAFREQVAELTKEREDLPAPNEALKE